MEKLLQNEHKACSGIEGLTYFDLGSLPILKMSSSQMDIKPRKELAELHKARIDRKSWT